MITEDYVSFETAKLLKERGFDAECDYLYVNGKLVKAQGFACNWNNEETLFTDYKNECSAPTLQMAMKWLREKYHIHISPYQATITLWDFQLFNLLKTDTMGCKPISRPHLTKYYSKTCEEACEMAIKYCLENLI